MTEKKKSKFGSLYFFGLSLILLQFSVTTVPDIAGFVGGFTIFFTSLAHFIVKVVSIQDGFTPGQKSNSRVQRTTYRARSQGNPRYDHLIRKMQLTNLSGMSVDQAATTYASFFNCGDLASRPFFSNAYVQGVLKMGIAAGSQSIVEPYKTPPSTASSSTGAFWSSMPQTSTDAGEVCSDPSCSNPVTVFDFRCFKCRNRFCNGCKGEGVTCRRCS